MITGQIVNKIGLECEVLIRNNKNELIIPQDYYLSHDDFIILGEIRSKPYSTVVDTVYEFYKDFYAYDVHVKYNKLFMDIQDGWDIITPEFYSTILKKMGSKEIEKCKNIYKTDILKLTDAIVEEGKIMGHKISCGLHIHFSSDIVVMNDYKISAMTQLKNNLFVHSSTENKFHEETKLYSLLTDNAIKSIVRDFDKNILPKYNITENLKFRNPGFYELKSHGFEYRSLPFNQKVYNNLPEIVEYAFNRLNNLSKILR